MSTTIELTPEELDLLAWNVSNEIVNGFKVDPFTTRIGVSMEEFKSITKHLRSITPSIQVTLSSRESKIFYNALALVLQELGVEEFQTRTGYEYETGKLLLEKLSQ